MAEGNGQGTLAGQVALVTGGSRGLGRAFAEGLAHAGAAVAVTGRDEATLATAATAIEAAGGRAIAIPADVTDRAAAEDAVAETERALGPVGILVNNAGIARALQDTWSVDPDEWWRVVEVNVRGPFLYARAVLPGMMARGHGRIINISSGAATVAIAYAGAYVASKAALSQWTNVLAVELQGSGVVALAYSPGMVRTDGTEYTAASATVHESLRKAFTEQFAKGADTPMEQTVAAFMRLASGEADALSGRHIGVTDDIPALARQADDVRERDGLTLRLRP